MATVFDPATQPRPGTSRRSQLKRSLHSRNSPTGAAVVAAAAAASPVTKRAKLRSPRRATTAPSKPADMDDSDMSSHTADGASEVLNKASSCPPLKQGLEHEPPMTPRIVPLLPTAAVAAESHGSPPPQSPPHEGATSVMLPQGSASSAALTPAPSADVAETAGSPSPFAAPSPAVATPSPTIAFTVGAPSCSANCSLPPTPKVFTPPPETPRSGAVRPAARGRGRGASAEPRSGGYQGRFCGRLFLKEDEAKLAAECALLGPLLGCTGEAECDKDKDAGRHTLAKIVRAIAAGSVRAHCQKRERLIQELEAHVAAQQLAMQQTARRMALENQSIRAELGVLSKSADALASAKALVPPASAAAKTAGAAKPAAATAVPLLPPAAELSAAMAAARVPVMPVTLPLPLAPPQATFRVPAPRLPASLQLAQPAAAAALPLSSPFAAPAAATTMAAPATPLVTPFAAVTLATPPRQAKPPPSAFSAASAVPPPPPMASFPMAAAFAASHTSAFARVSPSTPLPVSLPSTPAVSRPVAAAAAQQHQQSPRIARPTATIGVPPVVLRSPTRA